MLRERRRHANFKPNRKLDRKSSRGMIYENEELRLRTININAEVERGQSDIKKLRRENYQLRKEIWTLRDEYDRLGKQLKNKCGPIDGTISEHSYECAGDYKNACEYGDGCRCCSCCLDEDSVSCDMCNQNGQCNNKNVDDRTLTKSSSGDKLNGGCGATTSNRLNQTTMPKPIRNDKIDMNFDHLSVVSEECLSGSDDQSNIKTDSKNDPIEGIEESIYTNFQSTIPPLEHFENLSYKDIGPNIDSLGEIQFNGEMYQTSEPTPPPPTPPPLPNANRKSSSLPLPPPPTMTEDGKIVQDEPTANDSPTMEKPKYFFSALKSKRKLSTSSSDGKGEMRPDVLLVNNIVPSENSRLATIRKPHNPLKYPSNSNVASMDPETSDELDVSSQDIQGLSRGLEMMHVQKCPTYENIKRSKSITSSDSDQPHPYRTEMSLVLSYNGNKSKYSTSQQAAKIQESDIDTPPPTLPHSMKLLPNKLNYAGNNESFKAVHTGLEVKPINQNTDNSSNEPIMKKSQANEPIDKNKNDNDRESESNGNIMNSNSLKDDDSNSKININYKNNAEDLKDTDERPKSYNSTENARDSKSRRVSIHFNGIPMTKDPDTEPHSNDSDANTTAEMVAEELVSAAISCRRASRRFSCSRKLNDDGLGSFLYPPSPFGFVGAHKTPRSGRRSSFLSRRHSDGLIPPQQTQYNNVDIDMSKKNPAHYPAHCHRHHNHSADHCGGGSGMNIGESTGTSICNSIASSRESLASERSRRKLSITSHSKNGGKIPWCACWGNGCI